MRHVAQLGFRRTQQVYGVVRLRVKYQIAAAATMTSRITHHQSAMPPPDAAAPPGAVPGAVVCASASDDESARSKKLANAANEAWRILPSPDVSEACKSVSRCEHSLTD
jgi:hypothetical protein